MFKKTVQRGRSEQRGESYSAPYVEPLSDARTMLAGLFQHPASVPIFSMPPRVSCAASMKQLRRYSFDRDKSAFLISLGDTSPLLSNLTGAERRFGRQAAKNSLRGSEGCDKAIKAAFWSLTT